MQHIQQEKGQGLIEAVIALALVGVVMVGLTGVTLSTIRIARENEMEDVATQAMVEALDYLKAPGDISAYITDGSGNIELSMGNGDSLHDSNNIVTNGIFFRLDDQNEYRLIPEGNTFMNPDAGCDESSPYILRSLIDPGDTLNSYYVCVQIYIKPRSNKSGYDIYVLGVWESQSLFLKNNTPRVNKLTGFRARDIIMNTDSSSEYVIPLCSTNCVPNPSCSPNCNSVWDQREKNI